MRGIILTTTVLCTLSTTGFAAPPPAGQRMLATSAIVCDTKDQALELFSGSKTDDGKGILPIYDKYRRTINKDGEPACNMQPIAGPTVRSVEDLGPSHGSNGDSVHGWLIELSGENGAAGWALYGELVKSAEPGLDI